MAIIGGLPMILILALCVVVAVVVVVGIAVAVFSVSDKKNSGENSSKSDVKQDYFNQD